MATARAIMRKLFLADRAVRGEGGADPFGAFLSSLTPEEGRQAIAAWIARKRDALDWNENVCDMVSRYFHIPQKPLWPGEDADGYEEAARRLERRLSAPRSPAAGRGGPAGG